MAHPDPPRLRIGPYELRRDERVLLRDGRPLALAPRALDVLQALAERGGQLATKDDLMAAVWGERDVEEANLHVQVSRLRRVLGDDIVLTVAGRGYRLGPSVQPLGAGAAGSSRRLSVVVLPFVETGAAPGESYLADALTDDITTRLARIRGSFVIGTATAMSQRRTREDGFEMARELGVRWVLQGRVERDPGAVELGVQLSDAATGAVVWADTLRHVHAESRQLRREVVERLSRALDLELLHAEASIARALSPGEMQAADLVMQARALGGGNWSREHYVQALAIYERALALAPDDGEALARCALSRVNMAMSWPGPDVEQQLSQVEADVNRALQLDSLEAVPWLALSQLRQQQYRLDEAEAAADQALELNPGEVYVLSWRGELHKLQGRPAAAVEPLERCLALSPRDPHRWVALSRLGGAWLLAGEPARALPHLEQSHRLHAHWGTAMLLIASLVHLGLPERARELGALHYGAATLQHGRYNRVSRQPGFLRQFREQVFVPLVRCGLRPDLAFADAWQARQLGEDR